MARGNARGADGAANKKWTVLVYMAGDNSLDAAGPVDIGEMKKVGTTADVNVLVQFDGTRGATRRYLARKGTTQAKDVVATLGETNCGDPAVLEDFVLWGARTYPADHLMLVIWNHGAGWDDANLFIGEAFSDAPPPVTRKGTVLKRGRGRPVPLRQLHAALRRTERAVFRNTPLVAASTRGIAYDDAARDFLDSGELKRVLASLKKKLGRKIDVLGMDACLMSMLEVAYQVRGSAEVLVGSQEEEPGDGWPYDRILKGLAAKPAMTGRELAALVVRSYGASYGANEGVTQSATDLTAIPPLAAGVDGLAKALCAALAKPGARGAILEARADTQQYSKPYDDYCDLGDLVARLGAAVQDSAVTAACSAVEGALDACVLASIAQGAGVAGSRGLSIYFPHSRVSKLYGRLDFVRNTAWGGFLAALLAVREPRAIAAA